MKQVAILLVVFIIACKKSGSDGSKCWQCAATITTKKARIFDTAYSYCGTLAQLEQYNPNFDESAWDSAGGSITIDSCK